MLHYAKYTSYKLTGHKMIADPWVIFIRNENNETRDCKSDEL